MKTWVLNWSQSVAVLNTGLAWIKPPPIADSSTVSIISSFLRLDFPGSECLNSNFHKPMPMNIPPAPSQISLLSKSHLLTGIKFEFCSTGVQYLTAKLTASPPKGSIKAAIQRVYISDTKFPAVRYPNRRTTDAK